MPALGMAMEEAILNEWVKAPGEAVAAGDVVAVVETDKSTYDLVASTAGVLGDRRYEEGAVVPVGTTVTVILAPGESSATAADPGDPASSAGEPATPRGEAVNAAAEPANQSEERAIPVGQPDLAPGATEAATGTDTDATPAPRTPHRLSPRRRRLAALEALRLHGMSEALDAPAVAPTALSAPAQSPVRPEPVSPVPASAPPAPAAARPPVRSASMPRARAAIASAVSQSWATIPHFAVSRLIPADALRMAVAQATVPPARVTVTDALLRALALAVEDFDTPAPIGLSVATDRGVVNVSLAGLADVGLRRIARLRRDAVARARQGRLTVADSESAPVTLSNLGTHGVHWFTGIVPLGQGMLLTVGAIHDTLARDGDRIVDRPSFWATLNLDHREYDGADGARLLEAFASVAADTRVLVGG
ncbi:2-oxo acid dehydrogenase subunit E2 [Asanoa sp. NPDC049573]|uniref:2-oxo acid dehydrogenase subunit E2 n=1 Tax=Asanoa sp. NPDC049573 TaxID=3155396 RepID=UPI003424C13D